MPNRILRDWTDSFTIDELDVYTERFFTRLIMKADDYGRFFADTRLLRSNLFPLKTDIRDSDISRWLAACEKAGLIVIYNVATKEFLQITNFKQTLRQKVLKHPPPENDMQLHSNSIADVIPETKRIRNEKKPREGRTHDLSESNLYRKPDIPTMDQVLEAFFSSGGTEEMARKFFQIYEATGWYLKNSPIKNFRSLVYSFIENWNKNLKNGAHNTPANGKASKPGTSAARVEALKNW